MATTTQPKQAFIGAGANLGDRSATLRAAISRIGQQSEIAVIAESSLYETEPVGYVAQPKFLNLVLAVETTLSPEYLLSTLLEIEGSFGRVRSERWGPRTLDLDLLAFEGETRTSTTLELPHPRMFERAFVMIPLAELLAQQPFQREAWREIRTRAASYRDAGGVVRIESTKDSSPQ